jgi:DoxX-like family
MNTANTTLHAPEVTAHSPDVAISTKRLWAGRLLAALPTLFLLVDGVMKLFKPRVVVETTMQLGYPESAILGIGLVLLVCTILYLIPRTAVLGAVLLTAYLGGAVATHVRVGAPIFNLLFPIIVATLLWGGLWLRDRRLQTIFPLRTA